MPERRTSVAEATLWVGIDDTDDVTTRGTGHLMQALLAAVPDAGLATPLGATRHQLCQDPAIPSTSHNSSACLALDAPEGAAPAVAALAAELLEQRSAAAADPGLAVVDRRTVGADALAALGAFGARVKTEVVGRDEAPSLAASTGVHLSAHGGDGGGVTGALAAVGLHAAGDDGFFLWMPHLRQLEGGTVTWASLRDLVGLDRAVDPDGREAAGDDLVTLGDWVRPVWRSHRAELLLWDVVAADPQAWRLAPRYVVTAH